MWFECQYSAVIESQTRIRGCFKHAIEAQTRVRRRSEHAFEAQFPCSGGLEGALLVEVIEEVAFVGLIPGDLEGRDRAQVETVDRAARQDLV
jgi:hypothetical protein